MKMIKIIILAGVCSTFMVGCAVTQHLPSLTVGGKANSDKLLGASVGKDGLNVTAPLVKLEVPPLGVDLGGGDKK
jgi:hypothetical protein